MRRRLLLGCVVALFLGVAAPAPRTARPNIVFVLTDDLSWNLVPYMPQVQALQREGATFDRYFVTNSLCCPSRASIFSGRYPHSSGVLTNMPPAGGVSAFRPRDTFATSLQGAGYMTALMGKYLNGYRPLAGNVPPGWTAWAVGGESYANYDYTPARPPARQGRARSARYGSSPADYLTDVISRRGQGFIAARSRPSGRSCSSSPPTRRTRRSRPRRATPPPSRALTAPRSTLFDAPQLDRRAEVAHAGPAERGADGSTSTPTSACACSPCRRSTA